MERNVVDSVDVLEVGCPIDAMTLESEIVFRIHRIEILNGNAAFYGSKRIPSRSFLLHVIENCNAAVLILQRTLVTFEFLWLSFERVDYDMAIGCSDYCHWIFDVCGVATLGQLKLEDWIRLAQVPELQSLVPAS